MNKNIIESIYLQLSSGEYSIKTQKGIENIEISDDILEETRNYMIWKYCKDNNLEHHRDLFEYVMVPKKEPNFTGMNIKKFTCLVSPETKRIWEW